MRPDCFVSGALATVLRVSRCVGLAPLSFVRQGTGWRVRPSPWFTVYGYVLCTFINLVSAAALLNDLNDERSASFRMSTNTRRIVWIVDIVMVIVTSGVALFGARGQMKSMVACFNYLEKLNCKLDDYRWPNKFEVKKIIFLVIWMIFVAMLCVTDEIIILMSKPGAHTNNIRTTPSGTQTVLYTSYCSGYWILQLQQIQFIMIALHVLYTFKAINESLRNVLQDILETNKSSVLLPYANKKIVHSMIKLFKNSNNKVRDSLTATKNKLINIELTNSHHEKVRSVASVYATACDVVREVDRSYGLILLLMLAFYFYHLVITPYYFLNNFFDKNHPHDVISGSYTGIQLLWCIWHAASVIFLIEPCHMTHVEMEKTRVLVSHLMCCTRSAYEPLSVELETFYRHLVLNQASYSPLDVTTMTRSLVATMFGSITTYLVVLVEV